MLHSAIFSTFIKLPFVIKIFGLSIFEWPFYPGFTVSSIEKQCRSRSTGSRSECAVFFMSLLVQHMNFNVVTVLVRLEG